MDGVQNYACMNDDASKNGSLYNISKIWDMLKVTYEEEHDKQGRKEE